MPFNPRILVKKAYQPILRQPRTTIVPSHLPSRQRIAVCIALMIGTTGAWAYSTGEISELNNVAAQQSAVIEKHRGAVGQIRAAMPALSNEQALQLANTLLDDPARFQAFQSLDDTGRAKLFEHLAARLQGITLTTEHFDSFIAQIKDASLLRDLGVDSVRDLSSPEAERLVQSPTPGQLSKFEQPSKDALTAVLRDLDELTEDLKIEEEDKSADYLRAKDHIDGQEGLKDKASSPSALYQQVQDLKKSLATAATDEDRKKVADAIVTLQTQTQIWTANLGELVQTGTTTEYTIPLRESLKAINDRVIAGIQNTIKTPAIRCVTAYDPDLHMVVTRCN